MSKLGFCHLQVSIALRPAGIACASGPHWHTLWRELKMERRARQADSVEKNPQLPSSLGHCTIHVSTIREGREERKRKKKI